MPVRALQHGWHVVRACPRERLERDLGERVTEVGPHPIEAAGCERSGVSIDDVLCEAGMSSEWPVTERRPQSRGGVPDDVRGGVPAGGVPGTDRVDFAPATRQRSQRVARLHAQAADAEGGAIHECITMPAIHLR